MTVDVKQLTVTVAGTPAGQGIFQYENGGPDWHASWADLPKAELIVAADESLRRLLTRAVQELGVSLTAGAARAHQHNRPPGPAPSGPEAVTEMIAYAAFHRPDDDDPPEVPEGMVRRDERSRKHTVLVVRDEQGRAVWRRPPFDATIGELLDASEAGLLDGDPLELYLVLSIPQGSIGVLGEWQQFQQSLEAAWHLSGAAAQIAGALSFVDIVRRFIRRHSGKAAQAVAKNSTAWAARGAAPADLQNLLAARPWHSSEIAALLGCSASEAEAILWGLGFTPQGENGPWLPRGS